MRIGISGHQDRPGTDWESVRARLIMWLSKKAPAIEGLSCLAAGSDQVFAECILETRHTLRAVIPFHGYERTFKTPPDLENYLRLLSLANAENLGLDELDEESAFYAAGKYVVDMSQHMVFVWDGKPAAGLGGTADIVNYARKKPIRIAYLDPVSLATHGDWN